MFDIYKLDIYKHSFSLHMGTWLKKKKKASLLLSKLINSLSSSFKIHQKSLATYFVFFNLLSLNQTCNYYFLINIYWGTCTKVSNWSITWPCISSVKYDIMFEGSVTWPCSDNHVRLYLNKISSILVSIIFFISITLKFFGQYFID